MTCNVTELRHHLNWFDDTIEVFAENEAGQRYEIVKLVDRDGAPVLIIRRYTASAPTAGAL